MIYVFGHKNPDTDSTVSAISLSRLKNMLGAETKPYVLGKINREAEFVLNYFEVEPPKLLEEVNPQVSDLNFDKMITLRPEDSILKAYQMMTEYHSKIMAVSDEDGKLLGLVTMKDIAMGLIKGDFYHLRTSIDNIAHAIEGEVLAKAKDEVEGSIVIGAYYNETLKERHIFTSQSIVIVGVRYDVIEHAIM
jgi:manganese-dependent inorganic pyrophosphatase